ncbi:MULTISPECIES: phosphoketolase [Loigolactobacillus]|uniref:Probable phosphoketolase n=1 Tax=Loigolactobacillus backii TaxID=375175 RepID=A0A192H1Z8_9LACO|nr:MULTISPECIES: phosphoketolase family protein [Loigolactobacillus]ANK60297.1 phosphoketolase [Loigolactobacillus backii]ANK62262.1 phosphoketolase [Loigolactobacillus backii]ANK65179.1 phosphoketolase [Loigolactobacillus backii]ANK67737.1 phosphoketolase [Loigolactobacillus backii]ANK70725.1 phosphoketolase [Loigolactobacillus backii]
MEQQTVDYASPEYFALMNAYWRAANFLSVGQLYLRDNPLLKRPLKDTDVKVHPIGHWGTIAGQNFIYAHLNRVINKYDLNMFYLEGPGHGGQVMVSNSYLDGSYSDIYPEVSQDELGMKKLFKQFSFPGGIASHAAPETPGSIHEGGELGYTLSHATGAILDNPEVIAAAVIGDGETETGPLAASWFSNAFINPINDGAVLPIINMNGFKISNPTILARKTDEELTKYFEGAGWDPLFVEGDAPEKMHPELAAVMDEAIEKIKAIQKKARDNNDPTQPVWPMIIFRAPKGWTGPKTWDGEPIEGSFRAHQIPIPVDANDMEHSDSLTAWLKSYRPEELFDEKGSLKPELRNLAPKGMRRMAVNPITNGGIDPHDLRLPDYKKYALDNTKRGTQVQQDMLIWSQYLADLVKLNPTNFRIFGPDETMSNRLYSLFDVTKRQWLEKIEEPQDEALAPAGRIIDSQLSEHQAEGFNEGYTLTGRHGLFTSYEAFLRVVDSMLTQHFKWIRKAAELDWRHDYPSLNIVSTSTSFQQDHNGYTHQDPGILTHMAEKKPEFIREYLPADANSLLAVSPLIFNSREKVNILITSKQPRPQFYSIDEATMLAQQGLGIIDWASTDQGSEPDVVIAAAGTEPNMESLAAINLLHDSFPELKIRFVNVVDLLKLRSPKLDPRGLSDEEFDHYFTADKPVLFAYHGFEDLIRSIFYDRHNRNVMFHGYREEGDITTTFDMRVVNELDRYHLAKDIMMHVAGYQDKAAAFIQQMDQQLQKHHDYIRENGEDLPEIENWVWQALK